MIICVIRKNILSQFEINHYSNSIFTIISMLDFSFSISNVFLFQKMYYLLKRFNKIQLEIMMHFPKYCLDIISKNLNSSLCLYVNKIEMIIQS